MEKKLGFIFLLIFMLGFCMAVKPISQVSTAPGGYELSYPKIDFLEQDKNFTFHIHVFNASNGYPIDNTSTICTLHLYEKAGQHILKENMTFDEMEWELMIDSSNFSHNDIHSYIVYCYDGGLGGFISGAFEVNYIGLEKSEQLTSVYTFLIIIFGIFGAFLLYLTSKLPSQNTKDNENRVIQISWLKYLRFPFWGVSYLCFTAVIYISAAMALLYIGSGISDMLFYIAYIMMFAAMVMMGIFFLKIIDDVIADTKLRKDLTLGVDRG